MCLDIDSYVICMFDVLCEISMIININKFSCFSYIGIIISVYGTMLINRTIINKVIIRSSFRFDTLLILQLLTTSVGYWSICLDVLFVLLNVLLSYIWYCSQHKQPEIYNCC